MLLLVPLYLHFPKYMTAYIEDDRSNMIVHVYKAYSEYDILMYKVSYVYCTGINMTAVLFWGNPPRLH
jgi:hypothetical protein